MGPFFFLGIEGYVGSLSGEIENANANEICDKTQGGNDFLPLVIGCGASFQFEPVVGRESSHVNRVTENIKNNGI